MFVSFKSVAICLSIKKSGNTFCLFIHPSKMSYLKKKSCSLIFEQLTLLRLRQEWRTDYVCTVPWKISLWDVTTQIESYIGTKIKKQNKLNWKITIHVKGFVESEEVLHIACNNSDQKRCLGNKICALKQNNALLKWFGNLKLISLFGVREKPYEGILKIKNISLLKMFNRVIVFLNKTTIFFLR